MSLLNLIQNLPFSTPRKFNKNYSLYHQGQSPLNVFRLEEGVVGLFHLSDKGKETLFRIFKKGDILGHRSLIANGSLHAEAITLTPVTVSSMPSHEFMKHLNQNHELCFELMRSFATELGQAEKRLAAVHAQTAYQRIAWALVSLKLRHPHHTWTRQAIADYAISTFESVARLMTTLADEGLLIKNKRDYDIPDPQALIEFAELNLT